MKKMKTSSKIVVGMLIAMIAIGSGIGIVAAAGPYDASNPYTCTLKWVVPADTTFSVSFAGGETSVDFDTALTGQSDTDAEPDSQDASANTPIITVSNDGNLALNFSCNLTSAKPSWATLKVNDVNDSGTATTFDTTAETFATNVAISGTAKMFLWTTTLNATEGTTERTLQINTVAA